MPDAVIPTAKPPSVSIPGERWIQLVFQRGPLAVLGAGGSVALWKGLLPTLDIHQASFGASLLVLGAVADLFVWVLKRKASQRRYEGTEKALQEAAKDSKAVDAGSPVDRLYVTGDTE